MAACQPAASHINMPFRLPVRRFIQSTTAIQAPKTRFGALQWVLTRPLYRFQTFDLAQVPAKSRAQALRLELVQWTPFATTGYYLGWHGPQALVWAWDADKANQAMLGKGLKPQQVSVLPESVLHSPLADGLCLTQCAEGYEGQLWRGGQLERSRWLAQLPSPEEWLMFQRDAGTQPGAQQSQPPAPRPHALQDHPWVAEAGLANSPSAQRERLAYALGGFALLVPTLWFGFGVLKLQHSTAQLQDQIAPLQIQVAPLTQARSQALDHLTRAKALLALNTYPSQLSLMAKVAELLPQDKSYLKNWDFQQGQLKITVASGTDISTTALIGALQQAGPFSDVKAVPGRDPKIVTLDMAVASQ
jgi:Tfp pilus assembly protein PilN